MKEIKLKFFTITTLKACLIVAAFLIATKSQSVTITEIDKAVMHASQANKTALRLENELNTLTKKKLELEAELTDIEKYLQELNDLATPDHDKIKKTTKKYDAKNDELLKLNKKIDKVRTKSGTYRERANVAESIAKRLVSERELVQSTKKVEELQQLLEYYKHKVIELENTEREVRAEALAMAKIAKMSETQWERWRSEWNQRMSQKKADDTLEQLMHYRMKVNETTKNLEKAKEQHTNHQAEYQKYQAISK